MSERLAIEAFERAGALLKGHFVYTSGRHGADYLEKFRILEDPVATTALAGLIATRFQDSDAQLVEISLAFATTVFTNVFNRINDTEIDFPAVA